MLTFVRVERTDDIAGQFDLIAEASQGADVEVTILQQGSLLWYVNDVDAITTGRQEYNLKPFFYTSLKDIDAIKYRYEIMRDLENKNLFEHIQSFAQKMRTMREYLAQATAIGGIALTVIVWAIAYMMR